MITLAQAKELKPGIVMVDSRGKRWKVNGQVKRWKNSPDRIYVPLKHGLYAYDKITESDFVNGECQDLTMEEG